jgi:hypothetical protein
MATHRISAPRRSAAQTMSATRLGWWNAVAFVKFLAAILLIAQLGMVAHRIEHYIAPEHMESGEDECAAFTPVTGAVDLPLFAPPILLVVFFLRFWTVRDSIVWQPAERLGFRAHAPPY